MDTINIYVSLYKAPLIYSFPRWNLGFFPLSNVYFITSLSFFFFSRSSQIRSSVIQTPSLRSRFFRMTLYLSGRYTNLHIIGRGLESLLGPARCPFSNFGSRLSWFARISWIFCKQSSPDFLQAVLAGGFFNVMEAKIVFP